MSKTLSFTPNVYKKLAPREYLLSLLEQGHGKRPDGRKSGTEFRPHSISLTHIHGSPVAVVRIGETSVVAGVSIQIGPAQKLNLRSDKTDTSGGGEGIEGFGGWVIPNVELGAMCSPLYKPGPPPPEASLLSEQLSHILTTVDVVPLEKLYIDNGLAYCIYVDIICLNAAGSLFDTCFLALLMCLQQIKLPTVVPGSAIATMTNDESDATTTNLTDPAVTFDTSKFWLDPNISPEEGKLLPLNLSIMGIQAGVLEGKYLFCDPDEFESAHIEGYITVVVDTSGDVKYLHKSGSPISDYSLIDQIITSARSRLSILQPTLSRT